MVILSAGTQVGAGQPQEGEPGAVRAAPDGHRLNRHAHRLHGPDRPLHHIHTRFDLLPHIVVAVPDGELYGAGPVFPVQKRGGGLHQCLLLPEPVHIMIPDDIAQGGMLHLSLHICQVEKALVALRGLRPLVNRQQALELHGDELGVDHLALGRAGMDVQAREFHRRSGGVEVLVGDFPHGSAIHGVGVIRPEFLHVEPVGTPADLLVGGEADPQSWMCALTGQQRFGRRHNQRHASLVVGPQQGGAVGDDQVLAVVILQGGVVRLPEPDILLRIQAHIASVIGHHPGPHILPGGVGGGVHVGDQANHRQPGSTGDSAVDIAVFVHVGVGNAHAPHLRHQRRAENALLVRGGAGFGKFVGLGIKGYIAQKALRCGCHGKFSFIRKVAGCFTGSARSCCPSPSAPGGGSPGFQSTAGSRCCIRKFP